MRSESGYRPTCMPFTDVVRSLFLTAIAKGYNGDVHEGWCRTWRGGNVAGLYAGSVDKEGVAQLLIRLVILSWLLAYWPAKQVSGASLHQSGFFISNLLCSLQTSPHWTRSSFQSKKEPVKAHNAQDCSLHDDNPATGGDHP